MRQWVVRFILLVVRLGLAKRRRDFEASLQNPASSQSALLKKILKSSAATHYGKALGLNENMSAEEFRRVAPIISYDSISSYIEQERSGERGSIAPAQPRLFEPTSGSSGAKKYIPYTPELLSSFQEMFALWLGDLALLGPRLSSGRVWMSVSPSTGKSEGFEDDSQYLNGPLAWFIRFFLVLPPELKRLQTSIGFQHALAVLLVAEEKLEIISIWNPSLLRSVMSYIEVHRETIIRDASAGEFICEGLRFRCKKLTAKRAMRLRSPAISWPSLWPRLKMISCWDGAHAQTLLNSLKEDFPKVFIQAKGLLATEAPMTIPWIEAGAFLPLISEVFYEFEDVQRQIHDLTSVKIGETYQIIITQKGGLLRYRIGDLVRVTGTFKNTPCLSFVGRADDVADVVGEKLHGDFVADAMNAIKEDIGNFAVTFPQLVEGKWRYVLFTNKVSQYAAAKFDAELKLGHHYAIARHQGQLQEPIAIFHDDAVHAYTEAWIAKGLKIGDIKPRALIKDPELGQRILDRQL